MKTSNYVRQWGLARETEINGGEGDWPEPLRLLLMGDPGAGKSKTIETATNGTSQLLGPNWYDLIKQATPTGCASYKMSTHATTIHKLFGLGLAPEKEPSHAQIKNCKKHSTKRCVFYFSTKLVWWEGIYCSLY